jgi:alpha-1,2-mannosyltransferase
MPSAADASASWSKGAHSRSRPSLLTVALVFIAVLWTSAFIVFSLGAELLAWDVRFAYLPAAEAIADGRSPYPALDDPILEDQKGYVYPPQLAIVLLPLTTLPVDLAALLVTAAMLAMLWLTLHLVGVRDVRCYAASVLWMPVASGLLLANVSIPLGLALAVIWRYRERVREPALALGLAVSAKLLLWPLLLWTLATGRLRTTVWAVLVGVSVTFAAWAAIGFDGLRGYLDLLQRLSDIQSENSYSIVGMAATLGLDESVGRALTLVVGGGLLLACVVLARRGDEFRSFTCAVAATLALSPIVWLHYLVLLLVPLAIARPRFSIIWLLPILLWTSPRPGYAEGVQTFFPAVVAGIILVLLLSRPTLRGGQLEPVSVP